MLHFWKLWELDAQVFLDGKEYAVDIIWRNTNAPAVFVRGQLAGKRLTDNVKVVDLLWKSYRNVFRIEAVALEANPKGGYSVSRRAIVSEKASRSVIVGSKPEHFLRIGSRTVQLRLEEGELCPYKFDLAGCENGHTRAGGDYYSGIAARAACTG